MGARCVESSVEGVKAATSSAGFGRAIEAFFEATLAISLARCVLTGLFSAPEENGGTAAGQATSKTE